jgi:hypothetical protein
MIKDRIIFKLVNKESNAELLNMVPHVEYLDLAIIFYHVINQVEVSEIEDEADVKAALIFNKHMLSWEAEVSDLMNVAMENTPQILGLNVQGILTTLAEYAHDDQMFDIAKEEDTQLPLYVATNNRKCNGAGVILYKDMLMAMAEKLKSDIYVIPCSVHEVILVKVIKGCQIDIEGLRETIAYVNETSVPEGDILSDSLYYYSRDTNELCIA